MYKPAIMVRRLLLAAVLLATTPAAAHEGVRNELALVDAELKARPGEIDLLLKRAALYRRQGDLERAMVDLDEVAQKAPARRELLVERGLTQAQRGDHAAAEADLTRFLDTGAPSAEDTRAACWSDISLVDGQRLAHRVAPRPTNCSPNCL